MTGPRHSQEEREGVKARVIEAMAGGATLTQWCKDNGFKYTTVHGWLNERESDASAYVRARELGANHFVDECMDIADELAQKAEGKTKGEISGLTAVARLRIETRLRMAGIFNRSAYGPRTKESGNGSEDSDGTLRIQIDGGLPE